MSSLLSYRFKVVSEAKVLARHFSFVAVVVERQGLRMTETTKMLEMDENHAAGGKQKPFNASSSRHNDRENLDKLTKVVPSCFFSLQIWIT